MTFAHATFTASSPKEFRTHLLAAIRADFALDAKIMDELLQDGILRHGVWVNGRHIGYEAIINAAGDLVVTDIRSIRPAGRKVRALRTIAQIKAASDVPAWIKGFGA